MLFNEFIEGFEHLEGYLDTARQREMLEACRRVIAREPLWRPVFAGKGFVQEFALENTNCGKYGWLGDTNGFKYSETSQSGKPWQPIPTEIMAVVEELTEEYNAENCLINFYRDASGNDGKVKKLRLGLHQDRTERNRTAPIISISLGQSCIFQIGGLEKKDKVSEVVLKSGDIVILGGGRTGARNAFHGVKALIPNSTPAELGMKTEGRINITVRQVY
jgi:alkylated DNA repair protein (DNA oxidative demethylase)